MTTSTVEDTVGMRPICLHDLDFPEVPVRSQSVCGVPFDLWVRVGMPRIPDKVSQSVFYLYENREDALAGKNPGGTGFIVDYQAPFGMPRQFNQLYGVTNWHVAVSAGYSVIRLNRTDGGVDVIELGPDNWEFLPGRYDVAVVPLTLDKGVHSTLSVPLHLFLDERHREMPDRIDVGDDIFMIGLFVDHNGTSKNVPSARFGHISVMPNAAATIEQPNGYRGISYVVDLHSRPGFSGSPVFVYRTFAGDIDPFLGRHLFEELTLDTDPSMDRPRSDGRYKSRGTLKVRTLFRFLGVHWGQFREKWELRNDPGLAEARGAAHLVAKGTYVDGMSGMSCVIPSWQIREVLDMPKLKARRDRAEKGEVQDFTIPRAESASREAENPDHRKDFKRLLGAAAKTKSQDDQT